MLGFSNVTIVNDIENVVHVVAHGLDFYDDLFDAVAAFEAHDFKRVGTLVGAVLNQLSEWTNGHMCKSNFCYVVNGVLQFFGEAEGSLKQCEADFKEAFGNFSLAVEAMADSHHSIFHWKHDVDRIKTGVKDIGAGFTLVAAGVGDCHLAELADLIERLAVKLGIVPEVSFIEEVLHILIEGVHIEEEIGAACTDWSDDNWVGFGYNIAKLVKTLL